MILLIILHALVGTAIIAFGRRLEARGFAVAAIAPLATLAWLATQWGTVVGDGGAVTDTVSWVPGLDLAFDLRLDAFGALMVLLVAGIGVLVCIYSLGYFSHPGPVTGRLAGLLVLFAGAMLGVVLSDHLLTLFVFWELTTITSYLLIGNDDTNPDARDGALMAILITGAGGLVMLAGLIIIGQAGGTYRLSELAADPPSGGVVTAGLACVLIGAFTKSAQAPFSAWLPRAMVAPTPISTYLHAATMVKAGVYLIARLSPLFAVVAVWRPAVFIVGAATMMIGGWRALRQHDLKLLLAYGTVSQLGFMAMLVGAGVYDMAQAGATLLIAHGAFKAALFMVVGIIDHQVGSRDVRRLTGFGAGWWPVLAVGVISAASMAGLPPVLGFIAKEKALGAAAEGQFGGALLVTTAIVVGSILTVAYSGRFVLGILGRLGEPDADADLARSTEAAAPGALFVGPSILLTAFTVATGLVPAIIDGLVGAATVALYPDSHPGHLHLWAGFNTALLLSTVVIGIGFVAVAASKPVETAQHRFHGAIARVPSTDRSFWVLMDSLLTGAKRVTATVQNGSLPIYLMVILSVAAIGPLVPLVTQLGRWPDGITNYAHIPIAAIIALSALGATIVRQRIAAVLMLGAVGYAMAGFYVMHGAPDLALTQFAIETLATVLFVLVLRFLPRTFVDRRTVINAPVRLLVSVAVGVSVFVFAIVASVARGDVRRPSISNEMLARALPDGHGSNVVNVILVDFRGLDTLGEITVLVVAALGTVALARAARYAPSEEGTTNPGSGFARLPVVTASSRALFAAILVLSLYFLFAGHNQPGGGFVGGLTAGAAISLRYVAGGVTGVRESFRLAPWTILGIGMVTSVTTALMPLLFGNSVLQHTLFEQKIVLLGKVKATSALPFDIGVYLVVVGLILMAFEAFGDDINPDDHLKTLESAGSVGR